MVKVRAYRPRVNANRIITGSIIAGSGVTLMARIRGFMGALLTAESIVSLSYQAVNFNLGIVASTGTLAPSQVIFDYLVQNDPRWTLDSAAQMGKDGSYGYNFAATLDGSAFPISPVAAPPLTPAPPPLFQIDMLFTPLSGGCFACRGKRR